MVVDRLNCIFKSLHYETHSPPMRLTMWITSLKIDTATELTRSNSATLRNLHLDSTILDCKHFKTLQQTIYTHLSLVWINYISPLLQKKQNAQIVTSGDSGEKQTNSNFQKYDKCPNCNLGHSGKKKQKNPNFQKFQQ